MTHPAYQHLVSRYRTARAAWAESRELRAAARMIGMEEREYCDRYIAQNYGPLHWTSTSANYQELMQGEIDNAFDEAKV